MFLFHQTYKIYLRFIMNRIILTTINSILLLCLLCGRGFCQNIGAFNEGDPNLLKLDKALQKVYNSAADNTRIDVKPLLFELSDNSPLSQLAQALASYDLDNKQGKARFSVMAQRRLGDLILISKTNGDTADVVYNIVLPKIYNFAALNDENDYRGILEVYINEYETCIKKRDFKNCNPQKAAVSLFFLSSDAGNYRIDYRDIEAFLNSRIVLEEDKIFFIQYAAPMLLKKGMRPYFTDILNAAAANYTQKQVAAGGYVDPFAPLEIIDGAYHLVKDAYGHKDGFLEGARTGFKSKKPFREYTFAQRPAVLDDISGIKNINTFGGVSLGFANYKEPFYLSFLIRLYSETCQDEARWYETFSHISGLPVASDYIVSAHRDIALAKLLMAPPPALKDLPALKKYMAAKLSNLYFSLNYDGSVNQEVKAALKNELGRTYALLTGYKGKSPIHILTDEGFESAIAFEGNEDEIESLLGALFNFKERPAQSAANVFISGLLAKGIIKNSGKLFESLGSFFNAGKKASHNMPAALAVTKTNYKVFNELAAQNAARGKLLVASTVSVEAKAAKLSVSQSINIPEISKNIKALPPAAVKQMPRPAAYADSPGLTNFNAVLTQRQTALASVTEKYKAASGADNLFGDYGKSVFKIKLKGGSSGSGSYVKHRGLDLILTAGHVVKSDKVVMVEDAYGNLTEGTVLNSLFERGNSDIAVIMVNSDYLRGRKPFKLALKHPQDNEMLLHHGFSGKQGVPAAFTASKVKMYDYFWFDSYSRLSYLTTIGNITFGGSGGPLSYGYAEDKIVGIATAMTADQDFGVFLRIDNIRKFFTATIKKIIFDEPLRNMLAPVYPAFFQNYRNVLEKYPQNHAYPKPLKAQGGAGESPKDAI